MARIRTVKPDLFKHEGVADLPAMARLLFIGLFTLADVEGKLEDRPKRIKAEVFPYDNLNIEDLLLRLQSAGFIIRYEVGEMKVIQIPTFSKHQKFQTKELQAGSKLPNPPQEVGTPPGRFGDATGTLPEPPRDTPGTPPGHAGKEGNEEGNEEKEGKGKEAPRAENENSDTDTLPSDAGTPPPPSSAPPPSSNGPPIDEVIRYFRSAGGTEVMAQKFWQKWEGFGWIDHGNPIRNWRPLGNRFIANYTEKEVEKNGRENRKDAKPSGTIVAGQKDFGRL